jgi:Ca-activated chloride channel family protein
MTAEERESRLTAYALNDASLSPLWRQEIEKLVASDPTARQAVEETRRIGQVLTEALAAEQAATKTESVVTIPAVKAKAPRYWARYVVAAAAVLIAVGGTYVGVTQWNSGHERKFDDVAYRSEPHSLSNAIESYDDGEKLSGKKGDGRASAAVRTEWKEGEQSGGKYEADMTPRGTATGPKPDAGDRNEYRAPRTEGVPVPGLPSPVTPAASPPPPPGPGGPGGVAGPGTPGGPPAGSGPGFTPPSFDKGYRPGFGKGPAPKSAPAGRAPGGGPAARPGEGTRRASSEAGEDIPKDSPARSDPDEQAPADRHLRLIENSFTRVKGLDALSTFGVDVDTASYSIVRKYLTSGQLPPADAIRLEEMVNYFPYTDKPPEGAEPFAVTVEMAECPWEPKHRLVRLGLKAKPIDDDKRPPSNLVFLVDVSGSMMPAERLPLVKASLKLLVGKLRETDRVALVAYAGNAGLVLDSTSGAQKDRIVEALDRLESGGSTHGSQGIEQAYEVAEAHFIKNGTNRVILCTDGDWNVGVTSTDALIKLIERKRETGVFLSVFGFGFGNLRDEMLVKLSGKGNGNYAYIDTLKEGHKVFVEQMGGTLVTVAKDVKVQVEFNPAVIKSYRLLGYEKRALAAKDFHDDKVDAGEMGAGHVVTALYELVPVGAPDPAVGEVGQLRFQKDPAPRPPEKPIDPDSAFVVKMRHKKPDEDKSTLRELLVKEQMIGYEKASEDFQFSAAVASFAMLLRDSPYKGHSNYGLVLELAEAAKKHDPSGYRAEFIDLVKKAKTLSGK